MKEKKESLFSRLMAYAKGYRYYTYGGILFSAVSALVGLLPYLFIWLCVCEVVTSYPSFALGDKAYHYAYWAIGTALGSMMIYGVALWLTHLSAFRVAKNIKLSAMKQLMSLPLGYFNHSMSGRLRRTVNDSAAQTETFLAHELPDLVGAYITPIGVLAMVFVVNWQLGLVTLIPFIFSFSIMAIFMSNKTVMDKMNRYQQSLMDMNAEAVEYVRGIPVVKTFGQSIFSFKRFHDSIIEYHRFVLLFSAEYRPAMVYFSTALGCFSIFLVGAGILFYHHASDTQAFITEFLFYIFVTPLFALMMSRIMWTSQNTMMAENALQQVDELFKVDPISEGTKEFPANHSIELDDISFSYDEGKELVIDQISLTIAQGETIALVGTSGGGKSTLASLIARFWDVDSGAIRIGGTDVREIKESELMDNISFVFQHTDLYKMTLLDNVREGRPEASEEEVRAALHAAQCDEIIARLPEGIHTRVGSDGTHFSGGEAQRIAIARAILKNAPIILLDEATAFTDPENEHMIQQALTHLSKDKTVVVVAHRLSSIKEVDRIVVVEHGRIVEQGSHDALLAADGVYNKMWNQYQTAFSWSAKR